MVNVYENLFIAHPEISPEELDQFLDRISGIISKTKGEILKIERWGNRKLAYKIEKQTLGYYCLVNFAGNFDTVSEIERNMRINDSILKYFTTKIGHGEPISEPPQKIEEKVTEETTASQSVAEGTNNNEVNES